MVGHLVARLQLDPEIPNVAAARRFIRQTLSGAPAAVTDDVQLIASELITNAIQHGPHGPATLRVERDAGVIQLTVESLRPEDAIGPTDSWRMPAAHDIAGRGLAIVRRVADELVVHRTDKFVAITATRYC